MNDLQALLQQIDQLSRDELIIVEQHLQARKQKTETLEAVSQEDVEAWMTALHEAINDFRAGLTEGELDEIIDAMNAEYVDPDDLTLFDWVDDLPEDRR